MNAALFQVALFATEQLLKHAPTMIVKFREIVNTPNITVAELKARREAIASQKFEDLVPNSQLPPEIDTPQAPV